MAPPSLSLLGSGGRAALALAALETVQLHTFHPDATDIVANFGPGSVTYRSALCIRFRYLHPLARPDFNHHPGTDLIKVNLSGPKVLRFGCLEGDFVVDAEGAVFDPQGGGATFRSNGSSAARLAVVLNEREARELTGRADAEQAALAIMEEDGAEAVIVKRGPVGALVVEKRQPKPVAVPAFRTAAVNKIGSGDVFSAMFSHYWLTRGMTAAMAAELASRQVADYAATRILPRPAMPPEMEAAQGPPTPLRVMVVSDTGTTAGLWLAAEAAEALAELGVDRVETFTSHPFEDVGKQLAGNFDVVLVLPVVPAGTAVQAARRARDLGIPCVGFSETPQASDELAGAGAIVIGDFAASVYSVLWAAA